MKGRSMAAAKDALLTLLAHEQTRTFLGKIANGDDPRRAAAELAGGALTAKLASALGAMPRPSAAKDVTPESEQPTKKADPNVVDAEFVEINVTESAKKQGKK